ncbi:hypothetical protein [Flavobacterium sp.]|uniref:hypothetical protein n=1 Tax=Flavobacterium sp. TaxID=239 RepID=UPI001225038B|nr:hypothetical protein [Flavobacterium sp.]RZJ71421.1 MAG: hypothetical protein EOO49_10190 [Flavobacterium sp.]
MKIKLLATIALLSIGFASCTKDEDEAFTARNARTSNEIDRLTDDVSIIAEEEYQNQLAAAGRPLPSQAFLPTCATVTTTVANEIWTSVIDFGQTGCQLPSGALATGQIIVSGNTDFTTTSHEVNYTFNDFFYNDRKVEGNRHVMFSWQSTTAQPEAHTVANIDLDLTVTYPNGNAYHRTGSRTRELIQGYDTPLNWLDNVYQVTGSWQTVGPNGTWTTSIDMPLVWYTTCPYVGAGTLTFSVANNTAILDYGDGTCDYFATLTVNGNSEATVLLN